jgi:hypothetical protein
MPPMYGPRDLIVSTTALAQAMGATTAVHFELGITASDGRIIRVHATLTSLGLFGQTGELLAVLRPI